MQGNTSELWGDNVMSVLTHKNAAFQNAWDKLVAEQKQSEGEDFDLSAMYPPAPDKILFTKASADCSKQLLQIETEHNLVFPKSYKEFLCTKGSFVLREALGTEYFELLSPEAISKRSHELLNHFIKRYSQEKVYDCYLDQIPLLRHGVVFATSLLRGSDEYDVYFFASEQAGEVAKIYSVEIKEGVSADEYDSIEKLLLQTTSDINELDDIL